MSKGGKTFLILVIIVLLALGIMWAVYENYKTEPANINATTDLPDENKGIDNIINDFVENEIVNSVEEANIVSEDNTTLEENSSSSGNSNLNENEEDTNKGSSSEVVEGTTMSREERAVELVKEYYEKEYGDSEGLNYNPSVYKDGRYLVTVGSAELGINNKFFFVDLNTGIVEEK